MAKQTTDNGKTAKNPEEKIHDTTYEEKRATRKLIANNL